LFAAPAMIVAERIVSPLSGSRQFSHKLGRTGAPWAFVIQRAGVLRLGDIRVSNNSNAAGLSPLR
jgi:hypothetical protein